MYITFLESPFIRFFVKEVGRRVFTARTFVIDSLPTSGKPNRLWYFVFGVIHKESIVPSFLSYGFTETVEGKVSFVNFEFSAWM